MAEESSSAWLAAWIALDWRLDADPFAHEPVAFRYDFELPGAPRSASLRVSAARAYALWLNGLFAGCGPARAWPQETYYDFLEIAGLLRPGANAVAALVLPHTGVTGYSLPTRLGFLAEARIETAAGTLVWGTGRDWKVRRAEWISSHGLLCSLPTFGQEHSVLSRAPSAWRTAPPEEGWQEAFVLGAPGAPPWRKLRPRPVPLLTEAPLVAQPVWRGRGAGEAASPKTNLARAFNAETISGQAVSGAIPGEWLESRGGEVWTFDFGRTRPIRPGLEVAEAKGELRLECYYDIKLAERPTTMLGFGTEREGFCDSFAFASGPAVWEGMTARGCRFLSVKAAGPGACRWRPVCRSIEYPFPGAAEFRCSDPFWELAWETSAVTLRSAAGDVFVDTCARESVLWTFDACCSAQAAFYTFGETKLWRHCLRLIALGVDQDGVPRAVVPAGDSFMVLFDQTLHWVRSCHEYYLATGDESLLEEVADAQARFLGLCESLLTREGLFVPPEYSWHWLDWAPVDKRAYSLPLNALLVLAAERAARTARALRRWPLAELAQRLTHSVRPALARFFDASAGAFCCRLPPGVPVASAHPMSRSDASAVSHGIHANALACLAEAGEPEQRRAAWEYLGRILAAPPGPENSFGPGWTALLLRACCAGGQTPAAMACAGARYGPFLDHEAPTWGESFDGAKYNTAHGWGAALNTFIAECLVGVRPSEAGWERIVLRPAAEWRQEHSYRLQTPRGPLIVEAHSKGRRASWPKGVTLEFEGREYQGTGGEMELQRQSGS